MPFLDWLRQHQNRVVPLGLLLYSLVLLSFSSYSQRLSRPSFFSRAVVSTVGLGQGAVSGTTGFFGGALARYVFLKNAEKENEQLRREVDELKRAQAELTEKLTETNLYCTMPAFASEQIIKQRLLALIIGDPPEEFNQVITINVGRFDGVKPRLPVLAHTNAVVGQILDEAGSLIGLHNSQVLLITDRRSRIPVMIQRAESRARGILIGVPELNRCEIQYSEQLSDVRVGDTVITSGFSNIFGKGWPVGKVESIEHDSGSYHPRIMVKPFAEYNKLEWVVVVLWAEVER